MIAPGTGEALAPEGADPGFAAYLERTRDEPIYVILGVQGSGTNLLGRILRRFFNFSLLRDRSRVFNAAARLGTAPSRGAIAREIRHFNSLVNGSSLQKKLGRALSDYEAFPGIAAVLQAASIRRGADFARIIYAYRAYSLSTTRMAIKPDDVWETIGAIDQVLPNRRIILLTRDFRDNLLSVSSKHFGPIEPLCAARYVKDQLAHYAAEYRRAGSRGFHVKFETLVNSPREFVEAFSRHFELTPSVDPELAAARVKIRPNKTERWKNLPPRELAWCEGLLRDEMIEFGYPPASDARVLPRRSDIVMARARDSFRRIPQKFTRVLERVRN